MEEEEEEVVPESDTLLEAAAAPPLNPEKTLENNDENPQRLSLSNISQSAENETGPASASASNIIVVLTPEIIAPCLSILSRTGNGLGVAYTKLECRGKSITDIELLRNFIHLKFLDVSDNQIKNLTSLSPLDYLLTMEAKNNSIENVPADLDGRKYLQRCDLSHNQIKGFDVKSWPLCHYLNLNDNQLETLKLPDFPQLYVLEARGNKLTSTAAINGAANLQKLYLAQNQIDTIVGLEALTKLEILHLRGNKISRLDGFSISNSSLKSLNLRGNQISDPNELEKLACLSSLIKLSILENPLTETNQQYRLEVIFRLPSVTIIDKAEVTLDEREEAASYKEQLEAEKAEAARLKKEQEEEEARLKKEQEEEEMRLKAEAEAANAANVESGGGAEVAATGEEEVPGE